jgi:protein-tyrosine sulfotransferase
LGEISEPQLPGISQLMNYDLTSFKIRHFSALYDDVLSTFMPAVKNTQPFLFIMGSGRNGSTLLSAILNNHPDICIPPEHNIIPEAIRYWYTHPFRSWNDMAGHVCSFLGKPSQWNIDIAAIQKDLLAAPATKRNVTYVLRTIYGYFAQLQGKANPIFGDKTPSNTFYIKSIKKQFPGSRIVFLVRDPRDVLASLLKADEKYYSARFDFMMWRWKNSIDKYKALSKKFPGDVMLLKYEDLVNNPQRKVDATIKFLGLKPEPGLLSDYDANMEFLGVKDASHHQNILNPISTASIGGWKHALTNESATRIKNKLGTYMRMFGYEV